MWIAKRGTDQVIQPEGNVRLVALSVRSGAHENMANGSEIQERWIPQSEEHPERMVFDPSECEASPNKTSYNTTEIRSPWLASLDSQSNACKDPKGLRIII